jgi:hypothetical protein
MLIGYFKQASLQCEVEFARARNLLLRCLTASLYLSDDITDPTIIGRWINGT